MKTIPLTKGKVAIVDDEDYEMVAAHRWYASRAKNGMWYAARKTSRKFGRSVGESMHQFIMRALPGFEVDHRNRDSLDNRRCNLRLATKSDNMGNMVSRTNKHGFKGVAQHKTGLWLAQIQRHGKRKVTYHRSPEEAARAYDAMARVAFGPFARLNFPESESPDVVKS